MTLFNYNNCKLWISKKGDYKMKEKSTYQLIDDQMLSLIMTWSELIDRMEQSALAIPQDAFDWEEEEDYTCPELLITSQYENLSLGILAVARKLISEAEGARIISLDDWRVINHMLWYAGTDEPIGEDWRH